MKDKFKHFAIVQGKTHYGAPLDAWTASKRPADYFFGARIVVSYAEDEIWQMILDALDIDYEEPTTWPMGNITFDDYDYSFELKNVTGDWTPTPEQMQRCWALGFGRAWICYDDGTERYCDAHNNTMGDRYQRRTPIKTEPMHDNIQSENH